MHTTHNPTAPDRADRIALRLSEGIAGAAIIGVIASTVSRLREVASGRSIPVTLSLGNPTAEIRLSPESAAVSGEVTEATFIVAQPDSATLFALWAQPIWLGLAATAGLVLAVLFFRRVARAEVFRKGSAALVFAGAAVILAGWAGDTVLSLMVATGTFDALAGGGLVTTLHLMPLLWVLLVAAMGGAIQMGERLQRDTDGLV